MESLESRKAKAIADLNQAVQQATVWQEKSVGLRYQITLLDELLKEKENGGEQTG